MDVGLGIHMTQPARRGSRAVATLGVPWEDAYGYAQAVRIGGTIYVSGQLGHDAEGHIVGDATDGPSENHVGSRMELQMRMSYANARVVLEQLGATLEDVVEEIIYVVDMAAAFSVAGPVRRAAYGHAPTCASTIVEVTRLALPQQLIEIRFTAVAQE
jgi:enamine deaminase RidA (YjgF/YER057c/UK114 family)